MQRENNQHHPSLENHVLKTLVWEQYRQRLLADTIDASSGRMKVFLHYYIFRYRYLNCIDSLLSAHRDTLMHFMHARESYLKRSTSI
jgi:hypothetical protein